MPPTKVEVEVLRKRRLATRCLVPHVPSSQAPSQQALNYSKEVSGIKIRFQKNLFGFQARTEPVLDGITEECEAQRVEVTCPDSALQLAGGVAISFHLESTWTPNPCDPVSFCCPDKVKWRVFIRGHIRGLWASQYLLPVTHLFEMLISCCSQLVKCFHP